MSNPTNPAPAMTPAPSDDTVMALAMLDRLHGVEGHATRTLSTRRASIVRAVAASVALPPEVQAHTSAALAAFDLDRAIVVGG